MQSSNYVTVPGTITNISSIPNECCSQLVSVATQNGVNNFLVSPETLVVNNFRLMRGMNIAAIYDANAPVPLIFPPQYRAVVITQRRSNETIVLDFFNQNLSAGNHSLQLNIAPSTEIVTANGQRFTCNPRNRVLLVYYSLTTRSIPPQTTPRKIVVMC